ncbi:MAG: esterase/lipase family protein [Candidatus Wenzhouxiangella sp. M2_3B_020]
MGDAARREAVVLVHGLWYGAFSMLPLSRRLAGAGFSVRRHGWATTRSDFLASADRLAKAVGDVGADRVHLVGHSLGGLLILGMLQRHADRVPGGRVVLLGSPVRGSTVARRMSGVPGLRVLLGAARGALQQGAVDAPAERATGVVAGTVSVGAGRVLGGLPKPHDGTVSVEETRLPGAADRIELPVSHTGLLLSRSVAEQVAAFLRRGEFDR